MSRILDGVRVLDSTSIVAGPFATMQLADLGADVISLEPPGGDGYRAAPPARHRGMGAPFLTINRGKRSIVVDLATGGGQQVLGRLADHVDVLVHNLRPAAAARLGLDAATVTAGRPHLIHCTTTGFGRAGPDAELPAYDDIIQGRSGLAALQAGPDGRPRLAPTILVDKVTGLQVAGALLAALLHRERTGQALVVEVPMLETMAAFLLAEHMGGRAFVPALGPPGYNRLLSPDRRPHATADGYLVVMPYTARHWLAFLRLADIDDADAFAWVADDAARAVRIEELHALLAAVLPSRTTAAWVSACRAADIPVGEVNDLDGLIADPHLAGVGMFPVVEHPTEGPLVLPRHPVSYDGAPPDPSGPAPLAGAHTREVLAELGLDEDTIEALLASGAVSQSPTTPAG